MLLVSGDTVASKDSVLLDSSRQHDQLTLQKTHRIILAPPRHRQNQLLRSDAPSSTLEGVFLPCLQNILGVILFLCLMSIMGQADVFIQL
jgi:hypothetical protein